MKLLPLFTRLFSTVPDPKHLEMLNTFSPKDKALGAMTQMTQLATTQDGFNDARCGHIAKRLLIGLWTQTYMFPIAMALYCS